MQVLKWLVGGGCAALCWAAGSAAAGETMVGAGSSAAAPVYQAWAIEYLRDGGAALQYDAVGSGAGMKKIRARAVDFGASDVIAPQAELEKDGLVMFPTVITGVVPVVNLPRVGNAQLRLSGEVLARILLGQVTMWNAPEIRALNPGLALPAAAIRVVCRADGSGTTWHLSEYLSQVSAAWKQRYGVANKHAWPADFIAVAGSGEVSKAVRATPYAIGYIDYNYVVDDGLAGAQMKNADGVYVAASVEGFRQAVLKSAWFGAGDFSASLTDRPGNGTWPITMGTYIAVPRIAKDESRTALALRFITWAYLNGDALAKRAKFVPLPERVQASAYRQIASVVDAHGELIGARVLGSLVAR